MLKVAQLTRVSPAAIQALTGDLAAKYPGGDIWLERRLDDIAHGRATCYAIVGGSAMFAVAIVTPKHAGSLKLSTFAVDRRWRRRHLGHRLLSHLQARWQSCGIESVTVTVDERDRATRRFFETNRFSASAGERVDYGANRSDTILRWDALGGAVH